MEADNDTVEQIDKILSGEVEITDAPEPERAEKLVRIGKMPPGQLVEAMLDEANVTMTDVERKQLSEITEDEALAAFMDANLGKEPFIGELKARSLFGSYMMAKMDHEAIGFAHQYMNIRSTQMCIEFAKGIAESDVSSIEEKLVAGKLWITSASVMSNLLKRYTDLAQKFAPAKGQAKARNKPPDIFIYDSKVVVDTQPST